MPETWGSTQDVVVFVEDTGASLSNFDICFEHGRLSENSIAHILTIGSVEVKDDLLCKRTGNVFIEYAYRDTPSGIMATTATHWCIRVMENRWVVVTVDDLCGLVRRACEQKRVASGGDNGWSRGALIPVGWLTQVEGLPATPMVVRAPEYHTTST